jgi:hypothetical protein
VLPEIDHHRQPCIFERTVSRSITREADMPRRRVEAGRDAECAAGLHSAIQGLVDNRKPLVGQLGTDEADIKGHMMRDDQIGFVQQGAYSFRYFGERLLMPQQPIRVAMQNRRTRVALFTRVDDVMTEFEVKLPFRETSGVQQDAGEADDAIRLFQAGRLHVDKQHLSRHPREPGRARLQKWGRLNSARPGRSRYSRKVQSDRLSTFGSSQPGLLAEE